MRYNRGMLILAVDTTTSAGSLAVLRDSALLGVLGTTCDDPYSARLFRQIEFLLAELRLKLGDFDLYAVGTGPGSFTGLRVGLTAVKAWAEVHAKPIAPVSALEAVAAQSRRMGERCLLAPVVDARRGQVYGGLYDSAAEKAVGWRCGDDVVMSFAEYMREVASRARGRGVHLVTTTPALLKERVAEYATEQAQGKEAWWLELEVVSSVLAPVIGRVGLWRARRGEVVDALALDAHYVRRSDAELLWNG
jgi:tRNA threonylcarbamoyladenosine biosynthesis protein TsaB